jgi:hypothetical protein
MDQKTEIITDWEVHNEWGYSTTEFEERVAAYCRDVVPEVFSEDVTLIIRELVRNILTEPLRDIRVLMKSQRAQLKLVIHSLDDGFCGVGYVFGFEDVFEDFHLESDQLNSYYEKTTLVNPLPDILLFVFRQVMSIAGKHNLFAGTTYIVPYKASA